MGEESKYLVLNYAASRIIGPLKETEVLVVARMLMQMSHTSFDILDDYKKEIVTQDFIEQEDKTWARSPAPIAIAEEIGTGKKHKIY